MKIKIPRVAFGSYTNKLGDTRLYYTEGCSDKTRYVKSEFQDARHVLSKEFASVLWQYGADKDVFRMKHVQGWNVYFEAEARIYPYRAAFEVARQDMEKLNPDHLLVSRFTEAIPQNTQYKDTDLKEGAEELELNVDEKFAPSTNPEAKCLSSWMEHYFLTEGKRLCIELDMTGKTAFGGAIFQQPELKTLLAAIELLPMELARFVSFGFAMDENYAKFASDNFLNVVVKGSRFSANGDVKTWDEVTKAPCGDLTFQREAFAGLKKGIGIPSATNTLDSLLERLPKQVKRYKQIIDAAPSSLKGEDWDIWLCKHTFSEIKVGKWSEFDLYMGNIPQISKQGRKLQEDFIASQRATLAGLALNEKLMEKYLAAINFTDKEVKGLRDKAVSEYLLSECVRFKFLFPEDCDYDFKAILTPEFLKQHLTETSLGNWWNIYQKRKCLTDKVKLVFKDFITGPKCSSLEMVATKMQDLNRLGLESTLKDFRYDLTDLPNPKLYERFPKANVDEVKEEIEKIYQHYKKNLSNTSDFLSLIKKCRGENEKKMLGMFTVQEVAKYFTTTEGDKFWSLCEEMLANLDAISKLLKDKDGQLKTELFRAVTSKCPEAYELDKWLTLPLDKKPRLKKYIRNILVQTFKNMDRKALVEFCKKTTEPTAEKGTEAAVEKNAKTPVRRVNKRVSDLKKLKELFPLRILLQRVQSLMGSQEIEVKPIRRTAEGEKSDGRKVVRTNTETTGAEKKATPKKPAAADKEDTTRFAPKAKSDAIEI